MSLINRISEELKYLASRAIGGKSREQIAEEERKAAEQKAKEAHLATLEREKEEREAAEKRQDEFVKSIVAALKTDKGVTSKPEIISSGATNQDIYDGYGALDQEFKIEISVGDKFTASATVKNKVEDYRSYKISSFIEWRHKDISVTCIEAQDYKNCLSKANEKALKDAVKECAHIARCISSSKELEHSGFLENHKDEFMYDLMLYKKAIGALEIVQNGDEYYLNINGRKIDFNKNTFEFSRAELASALGERHQRDLCGSALLFFEKRISKIAWHCHGLKSIVSKNDLVNLIDDHNGKTGSIISHEELSSNGGSYGDFLYTLSFSNGRDRKEIIGCEKTTLAEAYGLVKRRLDRFNSHMPRFTHQQLLMSAEVLKNMISDKIESKYHQFLNVYESGGPGIYGLEFRVKAGSRATGDRDMVSVKPYSGTINDLMAYINRTISSPNEFINSINKEIHEIRKKDQEQHDDYKLRIRP